MTPTPLAIFLELDLALNKLSIFARPVINPITFGTRYFNQLILRHNAEHYTGRSLVLQPFPGLTLHERGDVLQEEQTDLVPWAQSAAADKRAHKCIHDEPSGENDNESNSNVEKYLFGLRNTS